MYKFVAVSRKRRGNRYVGLDPPIHPFAGYYGHSLITKQNTTGSLGRAVYTAILHHRR